MEVSIIIPTYNRAETLKKCLEKISDNNFPKSKYEVLVIDDASSDNTEQIVEQQKTSGLQLKYFRQKKGGQGVARNFGIDQALGKYIIFIGDDIFICKTFIKEHFEAHQKYPDNNIAILGLTLWDPSIEITPLMRWLTHEITVMGKFGGHQFAYEKLTHNQFTNHKFFYTSNISVKKELLINEKFDPWFEGYGWEDIELGYRLEKKHKLKINYNNNAVAYHHHEIGFGDFKNRMKAIGKAALMFQKKHPDVDVVPSGIKLFIFKLLSNGLILKMLELATASKKDKILAIYYYAISKKFLLEGMEKI